jgi:D-alanyl-D-alanine carboxypeptidase
MTAAFVLADGSEITAAGGLSDKEANRPMDVRSRMPAGSVGKTFAAATALMLVEDGRISLDGPVTDFLEKLPWIALLPRAEELTLRRVLAHRTGLANYIYTDDWRQTWIERIAKEHDYLPLIDDAIRLAASTSPVCLPDTETRYADTNYLIVGRLIEAASGEDYYAVLQRRILDPLALRATTPQIGRAIAGVVPGYVRDAIVPFWGSKTIGDDGRLIYDGSWEYCGGGLVSTPADLARFMKATFEGAVLSPAMLAEMRTAWPMDYPLNEHRYGLGVQRCATDLGPAIGHTGQFFGYRSFAFYFENSKIAAAMQVNADTDELMPTFMRLAHHAHSL